MSVSQAKQTLPSTRDSIESTRIAASSEALFLKRLLYLKASIDNESTLNTCSVPFDQEKLGDTASPDQLLHDTQAIISGIGSMDGINSYTFSDMN